MVIKSYEKIFIGYIQTLSHEGTDYKWFEHPLISISTKVSENYSPYGYVMMVIWYFF
jgi:hypothetical protein